MPYKSKVLDDVSWLMSHSHALQLQKSSLILLSWNPFSVMIENAVDKNFCKLEKLQEILQICLKFYGQSVNIIHEEFTGVCECCYLLLP